MSDTLIPLGFFAMVAYIVFVKVEADRRRHLQATELHSRILEKAWKAQLLRRWDAERRAQLPLDVMDVVQIAGAAAAAVLLVWSLPTVMRLL